MNLTETRDLPLSFHNYSPLSLLIFNAIFSVLFLISPLKNPFRRKYLQSNWGGKVEWKKKETRCNANQTYSVSVMYLSELCCDVFEWAVRRDIWECEKGRQIEPDYLQKSLNFGIWEWLDWHLWIGDWVQSEQELKTRAHRGSAAQGWDMTLQSERKTGSDHTQTNSWRIWAEQAATRLSSQSWYQVCWERELGVSI